MGWSKNENNGPLLEEILNQVKSLNEKVDSLIKDKEPKEKPNKDK